jgi:hypothetical protein
MPVGPQRLHTSPRGAGAISPACRASGGHFERALQRPEDGGLADLVFLRQRRHRPSYPTPKIVTEAAKVVIDMLPQGSQGVRVVKGILR